MDRFVVQSCVTKTATGGVQQHHHHHLHSGQLEHQARVSVEDGTMPRRRLMSHLSELSTEMLRSSTERGKHLSVGVTIYVYITLQNHYTQNIQHIFTSTRV